MKRSSSLLALTALLVTVLSPQAVAASTRLTGPCKILNQSLKIGADSATCSKFGSKLVWKKAPQIQAASQSPSPSPVSQSPSPTSKSVLSPSLPAQSAYAITINAGSWFFDFSYSIDGVKGALKSDITKSKILFLPAGKLVQLILTNSADVPHGFSIPGLLVDKEILPGNKANVEFTPDKLGTYPSSCNISCGRGHATMTFSVKVISESDYLKYLRGLRS